ncbi:20940_t:CDS:2 [Cetraspora pellucida]|uniref:20940_t:CDS:1 n=1 Tax=Cetraspora pellucida TaxID=1433469 RepID=A0A9N9DHM6_9GLOM|nr:20940_t:CDS:2 [Cetraspora pellucida]
MCNESISDGVVPIGAKHNSNLADETNLLFDSLDESNFRYLYLISAILPWFGYTYARITRTKPYIAMLFQTDTNTITLDFNVLLEFPHQYKIG